MTTSRANEAEAGKVRSRASVRLSFLWAVIAVALPATVLLPTRLTTIDLAYHVRLGDQMLETHVLPRVDTFTFSAAGRSWIDQQWGAQLALALAHRAGDWDGLIVLRSALIALTFALVWLSCRAAGATARAAAFLATGSFVVCLRGLALRPQLFAFVLFAACVWAVAGRRTHPHRLWSIPALIVAWANLHGTFFFALVLLLLAAITDRRDRRAFKRDVVVASVALVATLVNPFGPIVWRYVGDVTTNGTIARMVSEWSPPTIRSQTGVAFFTSVALVAGFLARRGRATSWSTMLTLGGFAALGLATERGVFWWALAAPAALAAELDAEDAPSARVPASIGALAVAAFAVAITALMPWRTHPPGAPLAVTDAPAGATAVLAAMPPGVRIFNAQPLGSWFEYALPEDRVFVDSRIELFPASVWDDYLDVSRGRVGWDVVLNRRRVDAVVATIEDQAELIERLRRDDGWMMRYGNGTTFVFVRR